MKRRCVLVEMTVLMLLPTTIWGTENHTSNPRMEFIVASANRNIQVLEDVEVLLVKKDGLVVLGRTSGVGLLTVDRDLLQQEGALAVLFCKEVYFCGAFRLEDPEFFEYDQDFITLAPFALR